MFKNKKVKNDMIKLKGYHDCFLIIYIKMININEVINDYKTIIFKSTHEQVVNGRQ